MAFSLQVKASSTSRSSDTPHELEILVNRFIRNCPQISGSVNVCLNKSHSGLFIELSGELKSSLTNKSVPLLPPRPRAGVSPTFQRLCGPKKAIYFETFRFQLTFPELIPPCIESPLFFVDYKISVFMLKFGNYVFLQEKFLEFPGKLAITGLKSVVESEVVVDGVKVVLSLLRSEFLLSESIPFSIKLFDSLRTGVKKVVVSLQRKIEIYDEGIQNIVYKNTILDTVSFKLFLKREMCLRSGKLGGKCKIPSYSSPANGFPRHRQLKFGIGYFVEIQVVTTDLKSGATSIPIVLGTMYAEPGQQSSSPVDGESSNVIANPFLPTAPSFSSISRSTSLLSLFPPSYSCLGSRRASESSLASIETLPPHYEDVLGDGESLE